MALVAVEAPGGGLVAVPRVGINRGDHPVLRDPPSNHEPAVIIGVEVLADHGRQQPGGLGDRPGEVPAIDQPQTCVGVDGERVDQHPTIVWVVPIAERFPGGHVVIVTDQHLPHLGGQFRTGGFQEATDRGADHGDGVLGGDSVVDRR